RGQEPEIVVVGQDVESAEPRPIDGRRKTLDRWPATPTDEPYGIFEIGVEQSLDEFALLTLTASDHVSPASLCRSAGTVAPRNEEEVSGPSLNDGDSGEKQVAERI